MIAMVNGYVCRDCTDEALAKRGIDPAHAKDGPERMRRADAASGQGDHAVRAQLGVNQPVAGAGLGHALNVLG
jgi:hypothetical protein